MKIAKLNHQLISMIEKQDRLNHAVYLFLVFKFAFILKLIVFKAAQLVIQLPHDQKIR